MNYFLLFLFLFTTNLLHSQEKEYREKLNFTYDYSKFSIHLENNTTFLLQFDDNYFYSTNIDSGWIQIFKNTFDSLQSKKNKLTLPILYHTSVTSFHQPASNIAIVSSEKNDLLLTTDGGDSYRTIETPLDQGYSKDSHILKCSFFKNYILVSQGNTIFYSKNNDINWKKLKDNAKDFIIDETINRIYTIDLNQKLDCFSDRFNLLYSSEIKKDKYSTISIQAINGEFYIFKENEIIKISSSKTYKIPYYRYRSKINSPSVFREWKGKYWNINQNKLVISEDKGKTWYQIQIKKHLGSQSQEFISDSTKQVYLKGFTYVYDFSKDSILDKSVSFSISEFIQDTIVKIIVSQESAEHYHQSDRKLYYIKNGTKLIDSNSPNYTKLKTIEIQKINQALNYLDSNQDFSIANLNIPDSLVIDFNKRVLNNSILKNITNANELYNSYIHDEFFNESSFRSNEFVYMKFINSKNDYIILKRNFSFHTYPLPLILEYRNAEYKIYNFQLSSFFLKLIPESFTDKMIRSNSELLIELERYYNNLLLNN